MSRLSAVGGIRHRRDRRDEIQWKYSCFKTMYFYRIPTVYQLYINASIPMLK